MHHGMDLKGEVHGVLKAGVPSAACPVWLVVFVGPSVIHQRHDPSAARSRAAGAPGGLRHSTR